jgi:alpha-tubulin suppressor-like RCC1 family protein
MPIGFKATYNGRSTEIDDLLIKREFFSDGGLYTWGDNYAYGQLGTNNTTNRSSPGSTAAGLGLNWKDMEACNRSSAAIKSDGTLWTWGHNTKGELGTGNTTSRSSPGTTAGGGTNWKQVSISQQYTGISTAAIKTDGTLWTWGANDGAQLGTDNYTSRSSPGTTVGGGTNWKQVSCGLIHMAAIKTDGTLWTWGFNSSGVLGTGDLTQRSSPGTTVGGGTNWKQVSSGENRMAAVKTDGTLWTWGSNTQGQLGEGTTTARSSPGTTAGGGTNWKEVTAGRASMAIKTDGTLWTWGWDNYGILGIGSGSRTDRSSPGTTSGGGTNWKSVGRSMTNGYNCGAAIKTDGTLWTWGFNQNGGLGRGTTNDAFAGGSASPGTVVGGVTTWKQVAVGVQHMMGIVDMTI